MRRNLDSSGNISGQTIDGTEKLAQNLNISSWKASSAVNTIFEIMTEALEKGRGVEIR